MRVGRARLRLRVAVSCADRAAGGGTSCTRILTLIALTLAAPDAVDRLAAEIRASVSATAVLQRRCASGPIRAEVDRGVDVRPTAAQRRRLKIGSRRAVAYRRVRLMCGATLFSAAENWYVPARLTPDMRAALARDTPFGVAVRPLEPTRKVLSVTRLRGDPVLRVRAMVLRSDDMPLAEVVENTTRAALN